MEKALIEFIRAHARAYHINRRVEMAVPVSALVEADLRPAKRGCWERDTRVMYPNLYRCSLCGREIRPWDETELKNYPYCHCGARMTEAEE